MPSGRTNRGLANRVKVVRRRIARDDWPHKDLSIAVLSDLHFTSPWTPISGLPGLVAKVNALRPDLILLGGDFLASKSMPGRHASADDAARELRHLEAPLGLFSVLGNHDWKDCREAPENGYRTSSVTRAFREAGMALLINESRYIERFDFWLVGFDSQEGHKELHDPAPRHDPDAAFADVPAGARAILLAHEPDYFAKGDERAFLQVSGHTHGGQANIFGWRPMTPSLYGGRYAWGHVREGGRDLVVSGGVGYSGVPMRIAQPPELTLIELTGS